MSADALSPTPAAPLAGLTVLDLTLALAGPFATFLLAGLGARVIKIENPDSPDPCRTNPPYLGRDGVSLRPTHADDVSVSALNRLRGKYAVTLNLKQPGAREVFADLVRQADIVVENFSAGTLDRLGVGYGVARSINPHMHLRGTEFLATVLYPDGREQELIHLPVWDPDWQLSYYFAEPPLLPAGTKIRIHGWFDNTADNPHNPNGDPQYADLPPDLLPSTECLAHVVGRMLPHWFDVIVPDLRAHGTVLVVAHGNSLRALVKQLDGISDDDIAELNIPTGVPLHYQLGDDMRPREAKPTAERYLGDPEAIAAKAAAVAAQASGKG